MHTGTKQKPVADYRHQRNQAVTLMQELDRKAWQIQVGYHRRSLIEVDMF